MNQDDACTLTVCRDCCCGSPDKHPGVDHDALLTALRAADGHRVRVSECLSVCERSNVVVVQPSRAGRRRGGRPVYLGEVLRDTAVAEVLSWLGAGGPGRAPMPPALRAHEFDQAAADGC
ncbi:hypothetical protein ABT297_32440 [Dactylosporangium sp. NPDC000555]|uniref:hypothetical protein n=1 Tax=Dactylosporangium sp. NPDC000555 TaxID=3154260 RepID=UPI0033241DDA